MKSCSCLLLVFILICSFAHAEEIHFRGLPWDTGLIEAYEQLVAEGIMPSDLKCKESNIYTLEPVNVEYAFDGGYAIYGGIILNGVDLSVAGYAVSQIILEGIKAYEPDVVLNDPEQATFFSATYVLPIEENHAGIEMDLVQKLTTLYGEPEIIEQQSSYMTQWYYPGTTYYLWRGDNSTGVRLEVEKKIYENRIEYFSTFEITYGRTDSAQSILGLKAAQEAMEINRLATEIEEKNGNYDGL